MDFAPATRWDLYRVLSEPVRLRLLALSHAEELSIGELAELLGESQPNVSRHASALKQAGLVVLRKEGTRSLVRVVDTASSDAVVMDALASGRMLCEKDGSLRRIRDVLQARDELGREYFSMPRKGTTAAVAPEFRAYLSALAPLLPHRALALDVGTGDGSMLDVIAPVFERVIAVDRSEAQLALAKERVKHRKFENVTLLRGELDSKELKKAVGRGVDVVFASRVLHHAPSPAQVVSQLATLIAPGGALIALDYAHHEDEAMRSAADLWLGFEPSELKKFARAAGLEHAEVVTIPAPMVGEGPDAHLPWQTLVAKKPGRASS